VAFKERIERMVHEADLGLDAVVVEERKRATSDMLPPFDQWDETGEVFGFVAKLFSIRGDEGTKIRTIHIGSDPASREEFDFFSDESKGTQRFFALTGPILSALDNGGLIVADEFDCSMHPLLTRKLVELFNSKEANQRGAQLIFATHDVSLLNPALFRRDQLWILEKNVAGASELFSLHDFRPQPRTIEAFWRGYLAGRYGGIPKFGPMLENLKVR
jgi:AAA15 family ATPase/GTPase